MKQKILLTGANRGLGLSLTKIYLSQGHEVFAIIRRVNEALHSLKNEYADQLKLHIGDVADEPSIEKAIRAIEKETDYIDMLINNAAVLFPADNVPIEQVDFSVYGATYDVNAVGPLRVVKYVLPLVRKGGGKRIVNISSEAGSITDSWRKSEYAYCMSKSALNMASSILQNYVLEDKIKVLAVHPGWFSSDMGTSAAPITPAESAVKVARLLEKSFTLQGPMYYDLEGKQMHW
ncbi:MAG: SDR family NAD(P)-dependent oxidoreductase [Deferribacteres bacterium]|nr:SDR family NAD(P)-dependent oxidoreductase [candidate division KSB1 bacterium]MCB9503510.1 SDR family NAD(P)-dependent oxidoreductase [Deferribacteres bacterium]